MHNTQKFIDDYDIVQRYSIFINRVLVTHTYRLETDPQIKTKYHAYLQKLKSNKIQQEHSFYDRQALCALMKAGKIEEAQISIANHVAMPDLTASKKVTDAMDKELQAVLKAKSG